MLWKLTNWFVKSIEQAIDKNLCEKMLFITSFIAIIIENVQHGLHLKIFQNQNADTNRKYFIKWND